MEYRNGMPAIPGDLIITDWPGLTFKNWTRKSTFAGCMFKAGLYRCQRSLFPYTTRRASLWRTHVRSYVGDGQLLSATTPAAEYETRLPRYPYVVVRYRYADQWREPEYEAIRRAANKIVGTKYDKTQILEMLVKIAFPEFNDEQRIFGSSESCVVCSSAGATLLIAAHESAKARGLLLPRPLGIYNPDTGENSIEMYTPAHPENSPATMRVIIE